MGISVLQLWMPILLSGALAWIASGMIHMLLKYHNADYKQLSNEDEVSDAIRNGSPGLGLYSVPHCVDMADMQKEEMQAKFARGPVAFVTIFPSGMPNMGKLMGQQVSYFIIGGALIGYCATLAVPAGADYLAVFRVVSAVAFLAYGWATIPYSIWYGHTWGTTGRFLVDALIYALVTAGTFAWLWPAAG